MGLKFQSKAIEALQESAERYIIELFEEMVNAATHAKRKALCC
jgi:histone H3/H4